MTFIEELRTGGLEAELVANAVDAVVAADADGVIRFWNPAAERIFGHSRQEALGQTLDLIIPERLRKPHWDGYRRVMATGQTRYGDRTLAVPALRADGARISIQFTVALLRDEARDLVGIGAIMRDVSDEWERQRALRRRVAELERELAARAT